jgi:hypothetical protein
MLIDTVIAEAKTSALRIDRVPSESRFRPSDHRRVLIEGRRCQVIPTKLRASNPEYPDVQYYAIYLPRTEWADFLIYVAYKEHPLLLFIIPRGLLTKDTGLTPDSLLPYQNNWECLHTASDGDLARGFEELSPQLQAVVTRAKQRQLSID